MNTLQRGNRHLTVRLLQRLLNKSARRDRIPGPPLAVDADFGPLTDAAVRAFQSRQRPPLNPDGIVAYRTWRALGLVIEGEHAHISLLGQPDGSSCWSAAASMIVGNRSVTWPDAVGYAQGGIEDHQALARSLGWRMLNLSPNVRQLAELVRHMPVWIDGDGGNWNHAVVLSGVYSDGDPSGDGTMFRIHDPWPPGRGQIYGSFANPILFSDGTRSSMRFVLVPH